MKKTLLALGMLAVSLSAQADRMERGHHMEMRGGPMGVPLPSFRTMDRNHDGCVSSGEYAAFDTERRPLPDFSEVDVDDDGCITLHEVRQHRRRMYEQMARPPA